MQTPLLQDKVLDLEKNKDKHPYAATEQDTNDDNADSASVVFPADSAPNISTILPLGNPPIPNAISKIIEPVGITPSS